MYHVWSARICCLNSSLEGFHNLQLTRNHLEKCSTVWVCQVLLYFATQIIHTWCVTRTGGLECQQPIITCFECNIFIYLFTFQFAKQWLMKWKEPLIGFHQTRRLKLEASVLMEVVISNKLWYVLEITLQNSFSQPRFIKEGYILALIIRCVNILFFHKRDTLHSLKI